VGWDSMNFDGSTIENCFVDKKLARAAFSAFLPYFFSSLSFVYLSTSFNPLTIEENTL
jgi:hypothetical protein